MRYVQVRGYLKSLGSRYGSHAFLWINVPVKHPIPSMHSERGLCMGSVFPSDPWMNEESRSAATAESERLVESDLHRLPH